MKAIMLAAGVGVRMDPEPTGPPKVLPQAQQRQQATLPEPRVEDGSHESLGAQAGDLAFDRLRLIAHADNEFLDAEPAQDLDMTLEQGGAAEPQQYLWRAGRFGVHPYADAGSPPRVTAWW